MQNANIHNNNRNVLVAFKLGKSEFMKSFIEKGLIYMNSIEFFKDFNSQGQGDVFEGAKIIVMANQLSIAHLLLMKKSSVYGTSTM